MSTSTILGKDLTQEAADLWLAEDGNRDIRFLANLFTQVSLPYKDPGDDLRYWERRNGNLLLTVTPGPGQRLPDGGRTTIGYPYGTMPRLLLAWLSTEAVRAESPVLDLGHSQTAFLSSLGMAATGGKNGTINRLRTQMNRLFKANIAVQWEGNVNRDAGSSLNVASSYDLWWSTGTNEQATLLPSTVKLTQEFFDEVRRNPVPLDLDALRRLRGSAQRLDLYAWLTYRMSYLSKLTMIPWDALQSQFGANFKPTRQGRNQFKKDFIRHLGEVRKVYTKADVEPTDKGLILRPSFPHVPFKGTAALRQAS